MFFSWLQDQEEKHKFAENYATYIGAFSNLEMAKRLSGQSKSSYSAEGSDPEVLNQTLAQLSHPSEDKITRKKKKKLKKLQEINGRHQPG